jgi:hypothetical protein
MNAFELQNPIIKREKEEQKQNVHMVPNLIISQITSFGLFLQLFCEKILTIFLPFSFLPSLLHHFLPLFINLSCFYQREF